MRSDQKEWFFNTLLILVIAALIALIAMQRFKRPRLLAPPTSAVVQDDGVTTATAATREGLSGDSAFPHLGKADPFEAIYTPPPPPPTRTPKPPPTPSLERATKGWTLQYPFRRSGQPTVWVFEGRKKDEYQIPEGKPFTLNDGRQTFEITAAPGDDRYSVILKFNDQERKFSLLE